MEMKKKKVTLYDDYILESPNVFVDKKRVKEILVVVVGTVIKYCEQGEIKISVKTENLTMSILIVSNGKEIDDNELKNMLSHPLSVYEYEELIQSNQVDHNFQFYLCKKILEAMNGFISVKSFKGQGNLFTISFAYEAVPTKVENSASFTSIKNINLNVRDSYINNRKKIISGDCYALTNKKVLVVDDVYQNNIIMKMMLAKFNIVPDIASNGKEAVDMHCTKPYDLVFMDINMPIMDGISASKIMKSGSNSPIIIVLSAQYDTSIIKVTMGLGIEEHEQKPISFDRIKQILQKYSVIN